MEQERAIIKVRYHINNALAQLKTGKKANLNRATTELECARSVLDLLIPPRERHKIGGDATEGS